MPGEQPVSLWKHPPFLRLWAGQSISVFGDQVTLLALPLAAVLTLDASAAEMGLLTAAGWTPHLLLSLVAGVWIDQHRHRRLLLVGADLARAAVLGTVPLAYALDALTIEQLYAVAFAVGAFTVIFDVAYGSFFLLVVPRAAVVDANSKLMVSRSASYVGGPALAGLLVQVLTAPLTLLLDAISFLGSAAFLRRIRVNEPRVEATAELLRTRFAQGFRFILGNPVLRAGLAGTATVNFFNFVFGAVVVLFAASELGLSAGLIGAVFSAGAVGALVGALIAGRVGRRIGVGPAIVLGSVLFPLPLVLFPLATGPDSLVVGMLVTAEFVSSIGVMIFDVNQNSLMVLVTPYRIRSRMVGAHRTVNYGVRPLGALLGGFLAAALGLRVALWIGAAGAVLAVLWFWFSPIRTLREIPEEEAAEPIAA